MATSYKKVQQSIAKRKKLTDAQSSNTGASSISNTTQRDNLTTRLQASGVNTDSRNILEKALNLPENQNTLLDILELTNRGGTAVDAVLADINNTGNPLQNAWEGLIGKQKATGADAVDKIFGKGDGVMSFITKTNTDKSFGLDNVLRSVANVGVDLATDPLNWVGVGLADDAVKGIAKGAKAVDTALDTATLANKGKELVFGFNKGQDLLGYGIKQGIKGISKTVSEGLTKYMPEVSQTITDLSKAVKGAITKGFRTGTDALTKKGFAENVSKMAEANGATQNELRSIMDSSLLIEKDFTDTISNIITTKDPDVMQTLQDFMGELGGRYSKILADAGGDINKLSSEQLDDVIRTFATTVAKSDNISHNLKDIALDLMDSGKAIATAKTAEELAPNMNAVRDILNVLADNGDMFKLSKDARMIEANMTDPDLLKTTNEMISQFLTDNPTIAKQKQALISRGLDEKTIDKGLAFTASQINVDDGVLGTVGVEKLKSSLKKPLSEIENMYNHVTNTVKSRGFDVNQYEEYTPHTVTTQYLEEMKKDAITGTSTGLKTVGGYAGDTSFVKGKTVQNYAKRTLKGNPVTINKMASEMFGVDYDTLATDPLKLFSDKGREITKMVSDQTLIKESLSALSDAVGQGLDNGLIRVGNMYQLFPDMGKIATNLSDLMNGSETQAGIKQLIKKFQKVTPDMRTITGTLNPQDFLNKASKLGLGNTSEVRLVQEMLTKYDDATVKYGELIRKYLGQVSGTDLTDLPTADLIKTFQTKYSPSAMARDIALNKKNGITDLTPAQKMFDNYFSKNLDNSNMIRFTSADDAVNKLEVSKLFGADKAGVKELQDSMRASFSSGVVYVDKGVVDLIERATQASKSTSELLGAYDKVLKLWKTSKLFNAGYPFRNLFGDSSNLAVGGMPISEVIKGWTQGIPSVFKLTNLQKRYSQAIIDGTTDLTKIFNPSELKLWNRWDDFIKSGLASETRTGNELSSIEKLYSKTDTGTDALEKLAKQKKIKEAMNITYTTSEIFDKANRFVAYEWASNPKNAKILAENGYNSAIDFVKATLFDYNDSTKFENDVLRRLFPFYTFMKKNTAYHMSNALSNTRKYKQIAGVANSIYNDAGLTDEEMPDNMRDNLQIPIGRTEDGKIKYLKINPSFTEAWDTLTGRNVVNALNPVMKTIGEVGTGTNWYTGQPLDSNVLKRTVQTIAPPIVTNVMSSVNNLDDAKKLALNPLKLADTALLKSLYGTTSPEANQYYSNADEIDRLNELKRAYENKTGKTLPTIQELIDAGILK